VTPPPRGALATVLTQAWVIGAVPGTFAGLLVAALLERDTVNSVGFFSLLIAFVALLIAAVPFLAGLALAMAAPLFVLRWRTPICLALPVVLPALWWLLLTGLHAGPGASAPAMMLVMAAIDAALAAAWVWWRTRALLPASPREVARVFE
jgi:hypothetical protein